MFDLKLAKRQGNIAKALIWRRGENGEGIFRWSKVSILNGPNEHGQYHLMSLRDGWFATSDRIRNLTKEEINNLLS